MERPNITVAMSDAVDRRDRRRCTRCGFNCGELWLRLHRILSRGDDRARRWWGLLRRRGLVNRGDRVFYLRALWQYDHAIPLAEGGAHTVENLRTLCRSCHAVETTALRRRLNRRRRAAAKG